VTSDAVRAPRWADRLPILGWLPRYRKTWLRVDLAAGAIVAALAVPQSLGYAAIAGVPVQVGLYAVPIALIAYAVLGSSPQLVMGPVSTVAVLSGSLVAGLSAGQPGRAVAYTAAVAIGAGLVLVVAGFLHIGWVAEFLSKPIVTGFVLGLTVLIVVGEIPNLLGIPVPQGDVLTRIAALFSHVGDAQRVTALVSAVSLVVLFGGSRISRRVPWSLIVLVVGISVSTLVQLHGRGVATIGEVPRGLPSPGLPQIPVSSLAAVVAAGAALGFVGLAEGLSAARLFALEGGYRIDADQELIAAGVANLGAGLLGGIGVAGSLSKTAANVRARGRTQVAGLAAAAIAIAVIVAFAPLLSDLPKAVLSAIVVNAVWGLMDFAGMRRYLRLRRNDFVAASAAAVGVLALGPLWGLLLAVGQSVFGLVYRSSRGDIDVLGRVPEEKAAWGHLHGGVVRKTYPGVLVLRINGPVFWVNAARVHDMVVATVSGAPDVEAVVLDLEATQQLDTTSVDMLAGLFLELERDGVDIYLVRVMSSARIVMERAGLLEKLGDDHIWRTISQGVRAARQHHHLKLVHDGSVVSSGADDVDVGDTLAPGQVAPHEVLVRETDTSD
jgi:SulP family sulfate permease